MVVMLMRFGPLVDPTPRRSQSATGAVIVAVVFVLQSSPSAALAALAALAAFASIFGSSFGRVVRIVSFGTTGMQRLGREWGSCRGRNGARHANTTDTASDSREHSSELALDARLGRRPRLLGLCTLHCLRQRRHSPLSVDVLDGQQVPLQSIWSVVLVTALARRLK